MFNQEETFNLIETETFQKEDTLYLAFDYKTAFLTSDDQKKKKNSLKFGRAKSFVTLRNKVTSSEIDATRCLSLS